MVYDIITSICTSLDLVFAIIFFFVPSFLRMFSISMLILSIGKILDATGVKAIKIVKWLLYIGFMLYSAWSLVVLQNVAELNLLDINTILFGVIAPICMMLIGRQLSQIEYKGHKIFGYYVLWLIYFIFTLIWFLIFPEQVLLSIVFMYMFITIFIVWLSEKIISGVE